MTELLIYGSANSSFVWTARLACEEKGVGYTLAAVGNNSFADLKSEEHLRLHPFGRIPAMRHGDFALFEAVAICRYVDEAFDGPALQPAEVRPRALMNQWISATNDYLVADLLRGFVAAHLFPSGPDGQPDAGVVERFEPKVRRHAQVIDRALDGRPYLAGDGITIADLLLAPIMGYVGNMPDGLELVDGLDNLARWWRAVSERPSFRATKAPALQNASQAA